MALAPRWAGAVGLGLLVALLAGCVPDGPPDPVRPTPQGTSNAFDAALTQPVRPGGPPGGTLRLGSAVDCPSWDPVATTLPWCWDVQRTYTRQLLAYAAQPGVFGTQVVPDLAESLGDADGGGTVWTYRLRDGITWEDGTAVTAAQVAAGVRRLFRAEAAWAAGGSDPVAACALDGRCRYPIAPSPVVPPAGTVATPDPRTVVVTLARPDHALDYRLALPAAAPVRGVPGPVAGVPMSLGPFRAVSYDRGQRLVLHRNPAWNPAADPVRSPRAERIVLSVLNGQAAVDDALLGGDIDLDARGAPTEATATRVLVDPALRQHADVSPDGSLLYLALMPGGTAPDSPPLDTLACRAALFYAVDRAAVARALGPAVVVERPATSLTVPTMAAYDSGLDPYRVTPENPDAATRSLAECGHASGFALPVAYLAHGSGPDVMDGLTAALSRIGVTVSATPARPDSFYPRVVGAPEAVARRGPAAGLVAWRRPTPDLTAWWTPIAGGGSVRPLGNVNYARLTLPVVDDLLASPEAGSTDLGAQADVGRVTDRIVMGEAVYLPLAYGRSVLYRNPRLTDLFVSFGQAGLYDYVTIGVGGPDVDPS